MKKYIMQGNTTKRYFVLGKGFFTANKAEASLLTQDQVRAAQALGFEPSTVTEAATSYSVNYIRSENLDSNGNVKSDKRNPSKRRFATKDEAIHHGSRFGERRKKAGEAPGSAGHIGFYVTSSSDPVNAEINWKTGLTNAK